MLYLGESGGPVVKRLESATPGTIQCAEEYRVMLWGEVDFWYGFRIYVGRGVVSVFKVRLLITRSTAG